MEIDFAALRHDLMNYAGTAWINGNPAALAELSEIESASPDKLLTIAERMGLIAWDGNE